MSPLHAVCTRNPKWKPCVFENVFLYIKQFLRVTYSSEVNCCLPLWKLILQPFVNERTALVADEHENLVSYSSRGNLLSFIAALLFILDVVESTSVLVVLFEKHLWRTNL